MQTQFENKKRKILESLETPEEQYQDLSPKGTVDEAIRPLIAEINRIPGLVTTSSCSGRVSFFCEGKKKESEDGIVSSAGLGGKGQGSWLYVSHSPIDISAVNNSHPDLFSLFGLQQRKSQGPVTSSTFIHLKFEPMILHILTASLYESHRAVTAALTSGFRESGAVSLYAPKMGELNPMVAVRSTGYSFDSIIGYQDENGNNIAMVDEDYLRTLVEIANGRFKVNEDRIARFRSALQEQYDERRLESRKSSRPHWEDPEARRLRKREEGLARQQQLLAQSAVESEGVSQPAIEPEEASVDQPKDIAS